MINIAQQRDLGRQIMSVWENPGDRAGTDHDFREQMLLRNHLEGMLPFDVTMVDGEKRYEYVIGDKYSLEEYFRINSPDRERMTYVLSQILETIYRGREYMLTENDYIIRPDTVFIDEDSIVHLVYFPGYSQDLKTQLRDLAQYFMENVDYTDESVVMLIYGFYMRTKEIGCTFEDLLKSLRTEPYEKNRTAGNTGYDTGTQNRSRDNNRGGEVYRNNENHWDNKNTGSKNNNEKYEGYESFGNGDRLKNTGILQSSHEAYPVSCNSGDVTELYRTKERSFRKPDPGRVFSESPRRLKIIGFLLPPAAVMILFVLFRSGLLYNADSGHNDVIKTGLAIILVLGGCFEAEKYLWTRFSKKLEKSLALAEEESEESTVFLYDNNSAGYPFSLVSDDQPAINVSHFPFFVGRDAQHCDYVMTAKVGISRYHMKIDREGDGFTISDLNSTNGTFINGERLAPHLPHRIRRGDELRIGKCIYYCN